MDAPALRVQLHTPEHAHHQLVHAPEGIGLVLAFAGAGQLLQRRTDALEHGLEQVVLVLEMPVDGASADPRGSGDFRQRGTGNALLVKYPLSGIEYLHAGFFGFLFGTSGHSPLGPI
ncbi:hypothetical protein D9M71_674470 [compost metagenome]